MRCKARARGRHGRGLLQRPAGASPEKFYSGRRAHRCCRPSTRACCPRCTTSSGCRSRRCADFTDVSQLRANQCCELHWRAPARAPGASTRTTTRRDTCGASTRRPGERFGPCNPEQFCAREMILDDQTLVVSLVGIAGTGKTLIALLSAYEMLRSGRVSRIEVYRLNAEAGRELGFLPGDVGDKMAPWAKPIVDNLDFIMRRLHGATRWTQPGGRPSGEREGRHAPDRRRACCSRRRWRSRRSTTCAAVRSTTRRSSSTTGRT